MELKLAIKESKQLLEYKTINATNLSEILSATIRSPTAELKHPNIPGVVLLYHERMPGEPKNENFSIRNYFSNGQSKPIYGTAVFVQVDGLNKVVPMTEATFEKLQKSIKSYEISITKEYINGGVKIW